MLIRANGKKYCKNKIFIFLIILIIVLASTAIFCININNKKVSENSILDSKDNNTKMHEANNLGKIFEVTGANIFDKNDISQNGVTSTNKDKPSSNNKNETSKKFNLVEKNDKTADKKYKNNTKNWNEKCDWNLILLNDDNPIPKGKEQKKFSNYGEVKVHPEILPDLKNMIESAKKDGIILWISSCYRSIEKQTKLHNKKIDYYLKKGYGRKEAETLARRVVAAPGTSEHNLGIAVDFNGVLDDFYKTKEYEWLIKNSTKYGFILRYQKEKQNITNKIYEPWHFRYIGKDHAEKLKKLNMCFEEYVKYLKARK